MWLSTTVYMTTIRYCTIKLEQKCKVLKKNVAVPLEKKIKLC